MNRNYMVATRPLFFYLSLLFLLSPVSAQVQETQPVVGEVVGEEQIKLDLQAVAAAPELSEELRKSLNMAYEAALLKLGDAVRFRAAEEAFDKAREAAPQLLKDIEAELAQETAEPEPEAEDDAALERIEQLAAQQQARRKAAEAAVEELRERELSRAARREAVPEATRVLEEALTEVKRALEDRAADSRDPLDQGHALRVQFLARRLALEAELASLNAEILSYDAQATLLARRQERAARKLEIESKLSQKWQELVTARRQQKAEDEARRAREALLAAALAHPEVVTIREDTARLTQEQTGEQGLPSKLARAERALGERKLELSERQDQFDKDRLKIEKYGLTDRVGKILARRQSTRANLGDLRQSMKKRDREFDWIETQRFDLEELAEDLDDTGGRAVALAEKVLAEEAGTDRDALEESLRTALLEQKRIVSTTLGQLEEYSRKLDELDTLERDVLRVTEEYEDYISARMLWIRTAPLLGPGAIADAGDGIAWLIDSESWLGLWKRVGDDAAARPLLYSGALLVLLLLLLACRKLRLLAVSREELEAGQVTAPPISPVLRASLEALTRSLFWPTAFVFVSWRLGTVAGASAFDKAISAGLILVAVLVGSLRFLREILRPDGLAERHLSWPTDVMRHLRRDMYLYLWLGTPLLTITVIFLAQAESRWSDSVGRVSFTLAMLLAAGIGFSMRRPVVSIMSAVRRREARLTRLRGSLFTIFAVWAPVLLAGLAVYGYYFTSLQLVNRLYLTAWLILALFFASSVVERWLVYIRRLEAMKRLEKRRKEQREQLEASSGEGGAETDEEIVVVTESDEVNLRKANEQTRRLMGSLVAVLFLFGLWGIWAGQLPALRIIDTVVLWGADTSDPITLVDLGAALLIGILTIVAGRNVPGFLEIALLRQLPLDAGSRYAAVTVLSYIITVVGAVLAFNTLGMEWGNVQWLVAAMTVGLSFGLQEIFANFVSGLILLFERPIRVGDTVTVAGITRGVVSRIRMRATTVIDMDRRELVIPNKEFITTQLVNWTLSDTTVRLVIPVGVAYGSDPKLVEKILLQVAKENDVVLEEPRPNVLFRAFGDSSLDFELRVFVPELATWHPTRHAIHQAILRGFAEHDIEIPFPQRDVHFYVERGVIPPT